MASSAGPGEVIGRFGLSEPDFRSNPSGMMTRAERQGNNYVLNGTKMWITHGSIAHVALVWAKIGEEIGGSPHHPSSLRSRSRQHPGRD